jgi:hypothetical protein
MPTIVDQGVLPDMGRMTARLRPPEGLGLDWPEHGGILDRIGLEALATIIGKFKPVTLGEIHAAGDRGGALPREERHDR